MDRSQSVGGHSSAYQLFILGLSIYVIGALTAQTLFRLDSETVKILDYVDASICFVFLADFARSLVLAEEKWRYMARWGWLDLASSIPTVDLLRWGRGARIFRIIRVLRALRATRTLSTSLVTHRAGSAFWGTALLAILLVVFGSLAILHLESGSGNIDSAGDALWWAFVTVTTVGYGDHYPITPTGRILAGFLMVAGIGLFGTFTAYAATAFLAPGEQRQEQELDRLESEVRALRELLERVAQHATDDSQESDARLLLRNEQKDRHRKPGT